MKGGLGATQLTEVSKTQKMDTETPAQKQAAAKLALRKQLEKTLLQVLYFEDSFKILQDFEFSFFSTRSPHPNLHRQRCTSYRTRPIQSSSAY